MSDYGIVNNGKDRFEVLDSDGGRRVAVFDDLSDAQLFIKIKESKLEALVVAVDEALEILEDYDPGISERFDGMVDSLRVSLRPFQEATDNDRHSRLC
jgi:hypothetical protein